MPDNKGIYTCDLTNYNEIIDITGLRINGNRGIRARYPNANPEIDGFGSTLTALNWTWPSIKLPNINYNPSYPNRNITNYLTSGLGQYQYKSNNEVLYQRLKLS